MRGIVVEYVLFCPLYEENLWAASPMNAANNVNGVGDCPRTEALTLKHPKLVDRQLAFVRRAVAELNAFDNVYFEVCNEPYFGGVTPDWQAKVAATIVEAEAGPPEPAHDRPERRQREGESSTGRTRRSRCSTSITPAPPTWSP